LSKVHHSSHSHSSPSSIPQANLTTFSKQHSRPTNPLCLLSLSLFLLCVYACALTFDNNHPLCRLDFLYFYAIPSCRGCPCKSLFSRRRAYPCVYVILVGVDRNDMR
jgi:hypothetical protein